MQMVVTYFITKANIYNKTSVSYVNTELDLEKRKEANTSSGFSAVSPLKCSSARPRLHLPLGD